MLESRSTALLLVCVLAASITAHAQPGWLTFQGNVDSLASTRMPSAESLIFTTTCSLLTTARIDPVISPGETADHAHNAFANTNFGSTVYETDLRGETTCDIEDNHSVYYSDALYAIGADNRHRVVPSHSKVYYRTLPPSTSTSNSSPPRVHAIPLNFRLAVSGDYVSWVCEYRVGDLRYQANSPTGQFPGTYMTVGGVSRECLSWRADITFAPCWDGKHLDSADHFSHVAYARDDNTCPDSHPIMIPEITAEVQFKIRDAKLLEEGEIFMPTEPQTEDYVMASGDPTGSSMHGAVINGISIQNMKEYLNRCQGSGSKFQCDAVTKMRLQPMQSLSVTKAMPMEDVTGILKLPGVTSMVSSFLSGTAAVFRSAGKCGKLYKQCGGKTFKGAKCCSQGQCKKFNNFFSQCFPTTGGNKPAPGGNKKKSRKQPAPSRKRPKRSVYKKPVMVRNTKFKAKTPAKKQRQPMRQPMRGRTRKTGKAKRPMSSNPGNTSKPGQPRPQKKKFRSTFAGDTARPQPLATSNESFKAMPGGYKGRAKTTRYWDCCKPSSGWNREYRAATVRTCSADGSTPVSTGMMSGCDGGDGYTCSNNAPFVVGDVAYGYIASGFGSEVNTSCKCYKLMLPNGKMMITQATNVGADLGEQHIDIQIPGGGVGWFDKGCSGQWGGAYQWGQRYGGVSSMGECAGLPGSLKEGCEFRFGWFEGMDNPTVDYEEVACPSMLTSRSNCMRP